MTTEPESKQSNDYVDLSVDIVSVYVSNNPLPMGELGKLLVGVPAALKDLAVGGTATAEKGQVAKAAAADIKKSITQDALISFEDGKPYKTLRRHLTIRGMTPETYRVKHGLPADYPMTSAAYSAQRSKLAKVLGLGRQRKGTS